MMRYADHREKVLELQREIERLKPKAIDWDAVLVDLCRKRDALVKLIANLEQIASWHRADHPIDKGCS